MVVEAQISAVHAFEPALISTHVQNQATTTTSQDIPATPSTAKTLLLLTIGSQFERPTTEALSDSRKSSAAHTEKLPFEESSITDTLLNAAEVQMDLILANQQTIVANQHAL